VFEEEAIYNSRTERKKQRMRIAQNMYQYDVVHIQKGVA
jgi:hypothetical protein